MANISNSFLIKGTNIAPIHANLYLAKRGENLKEKNKHDPKFLWTFFFFRRYIDDGFDITKKSKKDFEYWISEFNNLVKSIKIEKFKYGPRVEYMDLIIYKGNTFQEKVFF